MFGFVVLWVTLILLGTFLRGPNWNFFGPYEYWDLHKVIPLNNVNLSECFWVNWLGIGRCPRPRRGSGAWVRGLGYIICREWPRASWRWSLYLLPAAAAAVGDHGVPQVLRQDGLPPLHADVQPAAVDDDAADQDGAALGVQPEVHRAHR